MNIRETLNGYAQDGDLEIASCDSGGLVLRVRLPSRGNEEWEIRTTSLIHLDMNPTLVLGKIEFGGLDLLPEGYTASRNFDHGGNAGSYRVVRITDADDKRHFVVCYELEQIAPRMAG
jgi:hypothetical protein